MKISLIILTYDEIVGLKQVLGKVPIDKVDQVMAIDGGSTDGSIEYMREHDIEVHIQEKKGRGEAFRLAFQKADGDALLFFSPDGNENPDDIPKFKPLLEQGFDMVIADRMGKESYNEEDDQILKPRKWANNFFTIIANLTWNRGTFIKDTINGYRAITRHTWDTIRLDGDGYTIEYQSSIRCFKNKLKIIEFPTHESPRIDNQEGSPSISTGITFVKLYLSELFHFD